MSPRFGWKWFYSQHKGFLWWLALTTALAVAVGALYLYFKLQ